MKTLALTLDLSSVDEKIIYAMSRCQAIIDVLGELHGKEKAKIIDSFVEERTDKYAEGMKKRGLQSTIIRAELSLDELKKALSE